jgi:hypothetical protein
MGGLRYDYPWVCLSLDMMDERGNPVSLKNGRNFRIFDSSAEMELAKGKFNGGSRLACLVPNSKSVKAKPGQWSDAYGHATLWDGTKTGTKILDDGKTEDARVADHSYFPESQTVYFWEVTNVPTVVKPKGFSPNDSLRAIVLHDSIGPGGPGTVR